MVGSDEGQWEVEVQRRVNSGLLFRGQRETTTECEVIGFLGKRLTGWQRTGVESTIAVCTLLSSNNVHLLGPVVEYGSLCGSKS